MSPSLVEKDVQEQLLNIRKCTRRPGDVPYPFEYSNAMVNFDIWDHMFLVSCCRNLTMHQFERPPQVVLDLGCGGGYWAIEAAKQWTTSTIIGFDLVDIQPNLHDLQRHNHLARRVKWVHGNLLDGLPFPSSQFDFVRIVGIGLGVPEDEWQFVLEEISRVMKPGAVLEIIEEDLLFPCGSLPKRPQSTVFDIDLSLSTFTSTSTTTLLLDPWPSSPERKRSHSSLLRSKFDELKSYRTRTKSQIHHHAPQHMLSETTLVSSRHSDDDEDIVKKHPQDHSRIKSAWDAMLASRFLSQNLLSVLPFYLSTFFTDIQTHPPYKIPLPPNSGTMPLLRIRHSAESLRPSSRGSTDRPFDLKPTNSTRSFNADGRSVRAMYARHLGSPHRWPTMHLAKTVNTVVACKDAMWVEYEKLFLEDRLLRYSAAAPSLREMFETEWESWHNDMLDRIGMRDHISLSLAWSETPGDRPDWRVWRTALEPKKDAPPSKLPPPKLYTDPSDLCRSLRAFIAWKPL